VKEWVTLGTKPMKEARERLGLSYETVARKFPVSAKTYERYEKAGRVPIELLTMTADILELEVERPVHERVHVTPVLAEARNGEAKVLAELRALRVSVDALGERLSV
jgi:transcriptional regulator with XRE-family HTH domain